MPNTIVVPRWHSNLRRTLKPSPPSYSLHTSSRRYHSYRHGAESERAGCLVNALSTANVGETGKPMNILFDNFSLENGLQVDETFMRGLTRSLVAVPFVTADALARMCEPDSEQRIDHVLAGTRAGQGQVHHTALHPAHLLRQGK